MKLSRYHLYSNLVKLISSNLNLSPYDLLMDFWLNKASFETYNVLRLLVFIIIKYTFEMYITLDRPS